MKITGFGDKGIRPQQGAEPRLLKIGDEIVTVDEAMARTGRTRNSLLQAYRMGRRTWDALEKKQ